VLPAEPIIFERILAGSSGVPIEVSRKGKTPPLERGRGKVFPFLSSPIGSLRKPLSEKIMGSAGGDGDFYGWRGGF
jgi:hypothetical protein